MANKKENNNKKESIKNEKKNIVEEINLDEIDLEDLDFSQSGCNCAECPMNCNDNIEEIEKDKKK
jgi:hypothetical protein